MFLIPILLTFVLALAAPAFAAEPSALSVGLSSIVGWASTALAAVVAGVITSGLHRLFGITLEARHREALHSALVTGASLALSMIAELIAQGLKPEEARSVALQTGVDYVRQSVPDALKALKPADDLLFDMVKAKSAQLELTGAPARVVNLNSPALPIGARG